MAIILCRCEGTNGGGPDFDTVRDALSLGGEKVFSGKTLCKDGIDSVLKTVDRAEPIVIGGCWRDGQRDEFRDAMRKHGRDPFGLRLVPMLGGKWPESMILMLRAAAERTKLYKGARPDNLKPKLGRTERNLSRRQFLQIPKVRHELVPMIDQKRCRSGECGCRLCERKCGPGAIFPDEGSMVIRKDSCTGCGACLNACPADAIYYPGYSPAEITREIDVLLEGRNDAPQRRSVFFVCEESDLVCNDYFLTGGSLPPGVLPVIVPCLGMLPPFYMAYPVFQGADKVGLLACPDGSCRKSAALKDLQADRELTSALFEHLGIGVDRLSWITAADLPGLKKELILFDESLRDSEKLSPSLLEPASGAGSQTLRSLLGRPACRSLHISGLSSIPYGMVQADARSACTFCGVCEKRCPAGALTLTEEDSRRELKFTYGECVACGECVRACPERVLSLKRELDAGKLAGHYVSVLAAETQVLCTECGSPFLNEALTRKLLAELPCAEAEFVIRLCPRCRTNTVFRSVVNAESPVSCSP